MILPERQLHTHNSLTLLYTWQLYTSADTASRLTLETEGNFSVIAFTISWCSVYPAGNTCLLAWCFNLPSGQLTPASSICLRGRSIATVAREASREAEQETQEYPLAGNFTSFASKQSHIIHEPHGSINQQFPKRPLEITEETHKFPLPWASSSPCGASREVKLHTEQEKFSGSSSAFLAQEAKPQRIKHLLADLTQNTINIGKVKRENTEKICTVWRQREKEGKNK